MLEPPPQPAPPSAPPGVVAEALPTGLDELNRRGYFVVTAR